MRVSDMRVAVTSEPEELISFIVDKKLVDASLIHDFGRVSTSIEVYFTKKQNYVLKYISQDTQRESPATTRHRLMSDMNELYSFVKTLSEEIRLAIFNEMIKNSHFTELFRFV
jgi:hypothetical protein